MSVYGAYRNKITATHKLTGLNTEGVRRILRVSPDDIICVYMNVTTSNVTHPFFILYDSYKLSCRQELFMTEEDFRVEVLGHFIKTGPYQLKRKNKDDHTGMVQGYDGEWRWL